MTNLNGTGEVYQEVEPARTEPERSPLRWLWWLIGLLVLVGIIWAIVHSCTRNETTVVTEPAATAMATVQLTCNGSSVTASVYADQLVATIDGTQVTLPVAESASGVRYYADGLTLWEHQDEWMLIHNEDTPEAEYIDCVVN